jgi:hypothetical protein
MMHKHENEAICFERGSGSMYTAGVEGTFSPALNRAVTRIMDPVRDNYRRLGIAIIARAIRDTANSQKDVKREATEYLLSCDCREIMRLCGIRWKVNPNDIGSIAYPLPKARDTM